MNILLTCAGRRNYIVDYFKEAVKKDGGKVYTANSIVDAAAFVPADDAFLVPEIHHPNYIKTIERICGYYQINAIIPLFDIELPELAKVKEDFSKQGIQIVISSPAVINTCYDKWETYTFLNKNGFQTPKTYKNIHPLLKAVEQKQMVFPLIIKPRWGMGSIGITEVESEEELFVFYERIKRVILQSYLKTQSEHETDEMVLFQEKLHGQEYGLDVVNDLHGKYQTTFVKRKLAMRSGETDAAVTERNDDLMALGNTLADCLGHVANLDIDLFMEGESKTVIDMNPRFGGGYPFSHLAGANLPLAIISWLNNEEPDPDCFHVQPDITGYKGILPLMKNKTPKEYT